MPKQSKTASNAAEMEAFGRRLCALLEANGQPRRGAGRYLADRYKVSTVTANAWLNGTHRAETGIARRIAEDHGSSFDELYFGKSSAVRDRRAVYRAQDIELSPAEYELLQRYRGTDRVGREMIDGMIEVVTGQRAHQVPEAGTR